jgi:hypothetical protein
LFLKFCVSLTGTRIALPPFVRSAMFFGYAQSVSAAA